MKRRREGALVASRLTQRAIRNNTTHGFRFCPKWTLSHSRFFAATPSKPHKKDSDWEVIIGLEVHAQIASKTKLFSGTGRVNSSQPHGIYLGSETSFGAPPNDKVSIIDVAYPGVLPVSWKFGMNSCSQCTVIEQVLCWTSSEGRIGLEWPN